MVNSDSQVFTAQDSIAEGIDHGKSLRFSWGLSGLHWGCGSAFDYSDSPSIMATEWFVARAVTVFLKQPEPNINISFCPISGKASWFRGVEDLNTFLNFTHYDAFRFLKELVKAIVPCEFGPRLE